MPWRNIGLLPIFWVHEASDSVSCLLQARSRIHHLILEGCRGGKALYPANETEYLEIDIIRLLLHLRTLEAH
jgi:hypothetical protein